METETLVSLDFARLDTSRVERCGRAEVVYCPGKLPAQVAQITRILYEKNGYCLCSRAENAQVEAVKAVLPEAIFHPVARIITIGQPSRNCGNGKVGVVTAGTADQGVAEEAAVTLAFYGWTVERIFDVGVAGLHRIINRVPALRACEVLIVIAGMDGALPSVVAGLVEHPVIAVPTSVGYGANFGGIAPLLAMLNSCATSLTVTNIDNGFGAASAADSILRLVAIYKKDACL